MKIATAMHCKRTFSEIIHTQFIIHAQIQTIQHTIFCSRFSRPVQKTQNYLLESSKPFLDISLYWCAQEMSSQVSLTFQNVVLMPFERIDIIGKNGKSADRGTRFAGEKLRWGHLCGKKNLIFLQPDNCLPTRGPLFIFYPKPVTLGFKANPAKDYPSPPPPGGGGPASADSVFLSCFLSLKFSYCFLLDDPSRVQDTETTLRTCHFIFVSTALDEGIHFSQQKKNSFGV